MEGEGTFSNTERRVQWLNQVVAPPGDARPNWWIVGEVASAWGLRVSTTLRPRMFCGKSTDSPRALPGLRRNACRQGGCSGPARTPNHPGTPILHQDRFTIGKGQFMLTQYRPPAELPDEEYPYHLSTVRRLFHYHTRTMTGRVAGLNQLMDRNWMDIHPVDAEQSGRCHWGQGARHLTAWFRSRPLPELPKTAARGWSTWISILPIPRLISWSIRCTIPFVMCRNSRRRR